MSDMNGKVALITGASSGIGRATGGGRLASRGAKVVLAARREHELATLTTEIEAQVVKASFVVTDVTIAKDVERMVAHAIETFDRLDYAVNNAGIEGKLAGVTDLPEQDWDRVLDTNLKRGQLPVLAVRGPRNACGWTWWCDRQRRFRKLFSRLPRRLGVCRFQTPKKGKLG